MSGSTLPTVMTPAGLQPLTPSALNTMVITNAQALSPGLTVLPGGLIADVSGTATGACMVMEAARVDVINSITPLGANPFLLYQMGQMFGIPQGTATNANANVVFTLSSAVGGFVISPGFTVSDGSHQYVIQDGGVTNSTGQTQPMLAVCTDSDVFSIAPNTITQAVTSVTPPVGTTLSITNPLAGNAATSAQTISSYRAQVLQGWTVTSTGTPAFAKTLISNVVGVNPALISIVQVVGQGWKVLVGGGGDQYEIANAIFQSGLNIATLVGSTIGITAFTAANPGVVTTNINHGYTTGQVVSVSGATPSAYNGSYTITVTGEKTFTVGIDTSTFGTYVGGGIVTPNFRNVSVSLQNAPDTYETIYVVPPPQTVTGAVTWSTISTNIVSSTAVASLVQVALANYINSLPIGAPINVNVMISQFQSAVASILAAELISDLIFSISINGVPTSPTAGTTLIYGDPESYFLTTASAITVTQA